METTKKHEEKKDVNILESSKRNVINQQKGRKVLEDILTIQEMLTHKSGHTDRKTYNPLLSVTTV